MPPTSEAITAVPQAIASRLTIPSGSYTEGQMKAVAAERISRILPMGRNSCTQKMPLRGGQFGDGGADLGGDLQGVRRAAHSTTCTSGSKWCAAAIRCGTPSAG